MGFGSATIPKNSDKYYWTQHSIMKMRQYGLSAQRITRVIRSPRRTEKGIVKNTIAVMQPTSFKKDKEGEKTWSSEIWAMYQLKFKNIEGKTQRLGRTKNPKIKKLIGSSELEIINSMNQQMRIISAWRYPGVSPKNNPIPEEIINELVNMS